MKKVTKTILAAGLALAVATPALAEFKLNGYYRLMGYAQEVRSGSRLSAANNTNAASNTADEEGDSRQWIDQRMRLMATYGLNDNVAIVYQAEIDSAWGEMYGSTNGAQLAADSVNVETKNAYLDLKSGDFAARLGVQGIADPFEGVLFNDDMSGVTASYKMGDMTVNALYAKLYEDARSDYDDTDMYGVAVSQKINDNFKLGAGVYYMDVNDFQTFDNAGAMSSTASATVTVGTGNANQDYVPGNAFWTNDQYTADIWSIGVNADAKFDDFGINGFVIYQDLNVEYNPVTGSGGDADGSSYMATVKGTYKLANGDLGLRVLYVSPSDDDQDVDQWLGNLGQYEFPNENLMQFMVDKYVCNAGKERYAFNDAVFNGYGLLAFMASGNHKLPRDMYLSWGAGYFMAAKDDAEGGLYGEAEGDSLGYEIAARFGKKYFEKVDVSLNASYAGYGDFYDNTANNGDDPDATYKTYLMVNVPF